MREAVQAIPKNTKLSVTLVRRISAQATLLGTCLVELSFLGIDDGHGT